MNKKTASEMIKHFELQVHVEGGYYRETYRTEHSTAIYYLVSKDNSIALHRIKGKDELWHYYTGDPIEVSILKPDGKDHYKQYILGPDIEKGHKFQLLIPADHWQSARCVAGGEWTFFGCTVSPAFEYKDLEMAK
ncbi:uncharacterized protein [Antedon mediterranea]|uniref:uncharacterized protein n=1 Tax=Antedon mediterranea TaxID=105859 RepID=UPI003AF50CDA